MNINQQERKFVNEEKISKYLKCSLCLFVFKNPIRTKCNHLFCRECIHKWLNESKSQMSCPTFKKFKICQLLVDLLATNLIGELPVYCINRHDGCKWQGYYERVDMHEKNCVTKEKAERLNIKLDANLTDDEEEEQAKMNNPGNIIDRIISNQQGKKEEILQFITAQNENTNTQNTQEIDDPLVFLLEMENFQTGQNLEKRVSNENVSDNLPKQIRERKSDGQYQ